MNNTHDNVLVTTLGDLLGDSSIMQGLENLAQLPPVDPKSNLPAPYPGKPYTVASMGFRRFGDDLQVVVAANGAMPRYIPLPKFIALVEQMNNMRHSTVVLQNFQAPDNRREGRGQVVGRLVARHSAINIALGNVGVPIKDERDILRLDSFMINRSVLSAYYVAAKLQLFGENRLDDLIARYEGLRFYEIPNGSGEETDMSAIAEILGA